ncbi:MAG: glutamate-cysteine ligase family protein [Armatimonadota bacterium]|nr:glutamate-cysteine ligase family protein [Armatimonadota bacterium]
MAAGTRRLQAVVEALAARLWQRFPPQVRGLRRVGREAEFPVVWPDGRAGEVARLWDGLRADAGARVRYDDPDRRTIIERVDIGDVGYEVEVGRATVEVVLPPADDLHGLAAASAVAVGRLARVAAAERLRILGYGIQPRARARPGLITPKRRYAAFHRSVGRPWLPFTTTASDQVHVDVGRDELIEVTNVMNLLSGAIIALTANSSVYAGQVGRFCSGREGLLRVLGDRHGMPPRPFADLEDYVWFVCQQPCAVLRRGHDYVAYGRPLAAYVGARGPDLDAFLWHEHYLWYSARPRAQHATVEVRPACQQPPDDPLAAAALALALVEGWREARALVADALGTDARGPDAWQAMAAYRQAAIRDGIRAAEPAPRFLARLLDVAEAALRRRGRGEERLLAGLRRRGERRRLPADDAAAAFRRGGAAALVATRAL